MLRCAGGEGARGGGAEGGGGAQAAPRGEPQPSAARRVRPEEHGEAVEVEHVMNPC